MPRKAYKHKTTRIYYNEPGMPPLWWKVPYVDAKKSVTLKSTLGEALAGVPGSSVGCRFSLCAQHNKAAFDHPVIMAAFTKSTCFIITELKNGAPSKAVRYEHRLSLYVDLNDEDKDKAIIKAYPELMEMKFSLYKPQVRESQPGVTVPKGNVGSGARAPQLQRGALARAVKAGLVSKPIADALRESMEEKALA